MKYLRSTFFLLTLLSATQVAGQLVVNDALSPEDAVTQHLLGGGISTDNISFSGDNTQLGFFNSSASNLSMQEGIILATGSSLGAIGPNTSSSQTEGGGNLFAGDPDLELLSDAITHDAAILEFDFTADSDSILFRYAFASEEYDEYVCSDFNDVFGFFLSGPGIDGSFENNAVNLAVIPGTDLPVSINTINNGSPGVFGADSICNAIDPNWQDYAMYYVDNSTNVGGNEIQYDGFTTQLVAGYSVTCGETYHIKIAIADAEDDNLDSAVFLEAGSMESSDIALSFVAQSLPPAHPEDCLIEDCVVGTLEITRSELDEAATYELSFSGTASEINDFEDFPTSISFEAGESSVSFEIVAVGDSEIEGEEALTVEIEYQNGCGQAVTQSTTILVIDQTPLLLSTPESIGLCPGESTTLSATVSGGVEPL
ncbi:MAG: hypothetical protein HKN32_09105, partial [Flavobacteriales bacterium]|nr:hypothetical protein [Flavobacteriales bacterium]